MLLRQRQREATATKLAMQRALEWVARLEALDPYPDGDQPSSALDGRPGPVFGAVDATAPTDEASLIV